MTHVKRFFLRFEENLAALCLGGLLVTLFLQVFTRFITRDPLSWTEEAARYLYVYVVFLGSSAAVTERTHVAIDFLVLKLSPAGRLVVGLLVNVCVLFVLANLFYWGIRATLRQLNIPLVVLDIPYAWVYVVVPVTALLMTVRTLAVMRRGRPALPPRRRARARDPGRGLDGRLLRRLARADRGQHAGLVLPDLHGHGLAPHRGRDHGHARRSG